ncbi:alpha/beta fold hydrolase [Microbacterium terricola]|uniref:Alpha/beta hydrolase n=1 Tax=Microbacterium terricola TaxID=344163 RepID=A0ABM8DW48_9MICO|nr:alpha/beta hydrolase [Microbacterium terricola]UYK39465.1 alpha/beta hydrolase [Microbacterium terricola]BDV29807.1 alpha/beta hydrolase [Microbacterium terricola]
MKPSRSALRLRTDAAALGLRRVAVTSTAGTVVARVGRERGGPATVLLHGAAGTWTTWTPLVTASDLAGEPLADVVAIDLPGWGESGALDRVQSVAQLSDAVAEAVRALGYDAWRLVGHSLGGFVALDIAARHPDETLGVTAVSASGAGVLDAIRRPLRGGLATPGFAGMLLVMRMLSALGRAGTGFVRLLGRVGALRVLTAPLFAGRPHPSVVAAFGDEVRLAAFARAARLAAEYNERIWSAITCPVRAVRGRRDVFAGRRDTAAFRAAIADFREIRLADAGHFAQVERPDAVLAAMLAARAAAPVAPAPAVLR